MINYRVFLLKKLDYIQAYKIKTSGYIKSIITGL